MTDEIKNKLIELGVDYEKTMERFMGKEELYERFLKKFLDDKSFGAISEYLANGNTEEAFKASHTLKGVAGNLGLNGILESNNVVVEKLRKGSTENIEEDMKKLKAVYESYIEVLKML